MVATTQLRLALEAEEERRARLEYLSDNPIYIPNKLYLILIVEVSSLIKLTRTIHFFRIIHKYNACMYYVCIQIIVLIAMYLLCMIKARVRWCTVVCGECFNLG